MSLDQGMTALLWKLGWRQATDYSGRWELAEADISMSLPDLQALWAKGRKVMSSVLRREAYLARETRAAEEKGLNCDDALVGCFPDVPEDDASRAPKAVRHAAITDQQTLKLLMRKDALVLEHRDILMKWDPTTPKSGRQGWVETEINKVTAELEQHDRKASDAWRPPKIREGLELKLPPPAKRRWFDWLAYALLNPGAAIHECGLTEVPLWSVIGLVQTQPVVILNAGEGRKEPPASGICDRAVPNGTGGFRFGIFSMTPVRNPAAAFAWIAKE